MGKTKSQKKHEKTKGSNGIVEKLLAEARDLDPIHRFIVIMTMIFVLSAGGLALAFGTSDGLTFIVILTVFAVCVIVTERVASGRNEKS